jgi:hypothetical protein
MSSFFKNAFDRCNQWFAKQPSRRRQVSGRARSRRASVSLEMLEDRCVPAVFNVNSTADILSPPAGVVTLRSAIQAANATPGNNTINLTVSGTYKITIPPASPDDTPATENNATGDFDIIPNPSSAANSSLSIINTSHKKVVVDGNHLDRIFDINPNDALAPTNFTVIVKGFTIQNGIASPGDSLTSSGGGIRDEGNVSLTLTNMVVTNNLATADGGGVVMANTVNSSWTLTINNSLISNNHAGDAGGGIDTDGTGNVIINPGTVITGNTDLNQGAGVYIDAIQVGADFLGAPMTMTGTVVSNNKALAAGVTGSGGGISNAGNALMTIIDSTISDNVSGGSGGGFSDENNQGTLTVLNSVFRNNTAFADGGGIQEGGPLTSITNTQISGNSSTGTGAGIFANGTTLIIQSSTIDHNTSSGDGGGLEIETTGTGIHGSAITNTTITGNSALSNSAANGGGIDAPDAFTGSLKILNATINANFATNGGGVFWSGFAGSTFAVQNTIIAANFIATGGSGPDANNPAGTFTDLGGNLIGVSGAGSGNTGFTATTTQTGTLANPIDPLLGPLQNNGGTSIGAPGHKHTLQTEAPLDGSPAIGEGILSGAPTVDERGFKSVVNGKINVGAVSQSRRRRA